MLGEYSYGGTPSYIPNLEVKPIYADGTWLEAAWESMDLPSSNKRETSVSLSFFCYSKVRLNVIIFLKIEESYKKDYVDINNI